jgi:hypothetical protein
MQMADRRNTTAVSKPHRSSQRARCALYVAWMMVAAAVCRISVSMMNGIATK